MAKQLYTIKQTWLQDQGRLHRSHLISLFFIIAREKKKVAVPVQFKWRCTFEVPNCNILSWGNLRFSLHLLQNTEFTLVNTWLLSSQKLNCQTVHNGVKNLKLKSNMVGQYGYEFAKSSTKHYYSGDKGFKQLLR